MLKNTSYGNGLVVTFKMFSCICIWQDRILVVASETMVVGLPIPVLLDITSDLQ